MDREEILEKSRSENKNQDLYEKEVLKKASLIGVIVVTVFCAAFTIFELCIGSESYFAFEAILFALCAAQFIYKAVKLKRRHEIIIAVMYSLTTVCFTVSYILVVLSGRV